jgi:hypothetical protein
MINFSRGLVGKLMNRNSTFDEDTKKFASTVYF